MTYTAPHTKAMADHRYRINKELRDLGVSSFAMMRMATHHLPNIIHPDEKIGGVVYGHYEGGHGMLVATDRRIIFLDRKPLYANQEFVNYDVVSGVHHSYSGFGSTVTLHTRIRDFVIHTYNEDCAQNFVNFLEDRIIEHQKEPRYEY